MALPDELRDFLDINIVETNIEVTEMLVTPKNKGDLINFANLIEEEITAFLRRRTKAGDNAAELKSKMVFAEKIKITERFLQAIDPQDPHHHTHIEFAESIRLLRNISAHNAGIDAKTALNLAANPVIAELAKDFPESGWKSVEALRNHLNKY